MNNHERFIAFLRNILENNENKLLISQQRRAEPFPINVILENGIITGIRVGVQSLRSYPILSIEVFRSTIQLLENNNGSLAKGKAQIKGIKQTLGCQYLEIESTVEGYIAKYCFDKKPGETIFRRISAISNILHAAGICTQTNDGILHLSYK